MPLLTLLDRLLTPDQPRRISTQLLRTFLPAVLIPLIAASSLAYKLLRDTAEKQVEKELYSQALLASEATSQLITDLTKITQIIAQNPTVINQINSVSQIVTDEELIGQSIPQLEQIYSNTKLLQSNRILNDYLTSIAKTEGVAEIFFTEKNGFNVAYSNPTSDFVQRDEPWWQQGKEQKQLITPPDFDQSANTFSVDVIQAILSPQSGEFLGVLKMVVPSSRFDRLNNLLENTDRSDSQQVQLLDTSSGIVVRTITSPGEVSEDNPDLVGDEALRKIGVELIKASRESNADFENSFESLKQEYALREFKLTNLSQETPGQNLLLSFIYKDKEYSLVKLPNLDWVAIASMDYGEIQAAGQGFVWLLIITALILAGIAVAIILRLSQQLSAPLVDLAGKAELVALGDLDLVVPPQGSTETRTLAYSFNNLVARVKNSLSVQAAETQRIKSLVDIAFRMRESLQTEEILQTAVTETRASLATDRSIVYKFDEQWGGRIVKESVGENFPASLGANIKDPCFAQRYTQKYQQGRISVVNDIENADLTPCHISQLKAFQVKASVVAPILVDGKLFGLLIAHHCAQPRFWQESEVNFLGQLALQLGFALEQANVSSQREQARQAAETVSQQQREQKEALQQQLQNLLQVIEGASQGDLTVRAQVSEGEIGTVADFFNFIVESLRKIVTQVQQSATQVNTILAENEKAIQQLAQASLQQAEETNHSLESVEQMTSSIQGAVQRAYEAAEVAQNASETAQSVGTTMDLTIAKILGLQGTVTKTAQQVKRLGESSGQISRVVSLINQIAGQTNLLALNASLEAARAGEQGQGFAVVAEEIGQLANRSSQATKEIEAILDTIGLETSQVVKAMETSTAQVLESSQLVEDAKENLGEIVAISGQLNQLMQLISEATASGVETSQSVANLMTKIAQVSQGTFDSSRRLSDSLQRTVEVSEQLQTSVATFKVD